MKNLSGLTGYRFHAGNMQVRDEFHLVGRAAIGIGVQNHDGAPGEQCHFRMSNLERFATAGLDSQRLERLAVQQGSKGFKCHASDCRKKDTQ
jgi:hypothetical protein